MIDMREFGTRERVLADTTHPIIPPEEGDNIASSNANF